MKPLANFQIDRSKYDDPANVENEYVAKPGLTEELVRFISKTKKEPEWMLKKRLQGLELFKKTKLPNWGPGLKDLDLDSITYYVKPGMEETTKWEDLPKEIRETAEKIGVPEAERNALGGAGFQFDSEMAYHKLKKELEDQGVIFENMDTAVKKYPDLVKKHFMTSCIPVNDHKFIMLHSAVWSGGTFIYIPKNVKVKFPLQAYFRMNTLRGGQFEHTLIIADEGSELHYIEGCSSPVYSKDSLHAGCVEIFVEEGAKVKYSSVENWSKNVYNLNTKRALVKKDATIEWVNGNTGSKTTMLYPCSVLIGEGARSESIGIAFANTGQNQDTGAKVIHVAPNTSSTIYSKSISKGGGISTYRGLIKILPGAKNSSAFMKCDGLILDNKSKSDAIPTLQIDNDEVSAAHEASVGKIDEDKIFYLMSRGLTNDEAVNMLVSGFIEPVTKALPLEYAVELNKLILLEIEGH